MSVYDQARSALLTRRAEERAERDRRQQEEAEREEQRRNDLARRLWLLIGTNSFLEWWTQDDKWVVIAADEDDGWIRVVLAPDEDPGNNPPLYFRISACKQQRASETIIEIVKAPIHNADIAKPRQWNSQGGVRGPADVGVWLEDQTRVSQSGG